MLRCMAKICSSHKRHHKAHRFAIPLMHSLSDIKRDQHVAEFLVFPPVCEIEICRKPESNVMRYNCGGFQEESIAKLRVEIKNSLCKEVINILSKRKYDMF
jgi:hypothetical protein